MQHKRIKGFKLVGIELRTTNDEGVAMREIPPFWQKFFKKDVLGSIANQVEPGTIYALYTHYDPQVPYTSFPKGFYTYILGAKVSAAEHLPKGCVVIDVPEENYAVIDVKGPTDKVVFEAWQGVWSASFPFKRKYSYDLEIYRGEPLNCDVSLCISVPK